jgi:hypothetical protein
MERWAERCSEYGVCCAAIRWVDVDWIRFQIISVATVPGAAQQAAHIRSKARVLAQGRARKFSTGNF